MGDKMKKEYRVELKYSTFTDVQFVYAEDKHQAINRIHFPENKEGIKLLKLGVDVYEDWLMKRRSENAE